MSRPFYRLDKTPRLDATKFGENNKLIIWRNRKIFGIANRTGKRQLLT